MLIADRYCPRCDTETRWTNEPDHGLTLTCTGCGRTAHEPFTAAEQRRLDDYDNRPVTFRRRSYEVV